MRRNRGSQAKRCHQRYRKEAGLVQDRGTGKGPKEEKEKPASDLELNIGIHFMGGHTRTRWHESLKEGWQKKANDCKQLKKKNWIRRTT